MENFRKFLNTPIVKFVLHLLFFGLMAINIFYLFQVWSLEKRISYQEILAAKLDQQKSNIVSQNDYYNSDLYEEKNLRRELEFKVRGEEVIKFSEPAENGDKPSYIPKINEQNANNLQKWLNCFFGNKTETVKYEDTEKFIASSCRGVY